MKKFVRDDGSEVSLKTFKARYGKPEDIKIKPTIKTKPKIKPPSKDVVAEVATFEKLPKSDQSSIKFLENLKQ